MFSLPLALHHPAFSIPILLPLSSSLYTSCSHLHRSGHIEHFAIVTEEAIARGIRRIVALTGVDAAHVSSHDWHVTGM